MKLKVTVLPLLVMAVSCLQQRTHEEQIIPKIDLSLIHTKDLIWDLEALQEGAEFKEIDSTARVKEILFKGPNYNGESTEVFAYYSNPDIIKTGKSQGNTFPGVVLISGGSQPALKEWVERWALCD